MTIKVRADHTRTEILTYDDPTGGAGLINQIAPNDRTVQPDPESRDMLT